MKLLLNPTAVAQLLQELPESQSPANIGDRLFEIHEILAKNYPDEHSSGEMKANLALVETVSKFMSRLLVMG